MGGILSCCCRPNGLSLRDEERIPILHSKMPTGPDLFEKGQTSIADAIVQATGEDEETLNPEIENMIKALSSESDDVIDEKYEKYLQAIEDE